MEGVGDQYRIMIAGDVLRDGQYIEAWKGEEQVAHLFTAYESSDMTFWCADEIPLQLVEKMIVTAINCRHAENSYSFLLRKV